MAKVRVHELAKELGVSSKSLLAHLGDMGEFVKSASSTIEAPVVRPLARLRGTLAEVLESREHAWAEDAWVQVTLTDAVRPVGALEQLSRRYPHLLQLQFDPQGAVVPVRSYTAKVARREPLEVCCDFVSDVRRGAETSEAESALLRSALEAGRAARDEREDEGRARRRGAA